MERVFEISRRLVSQVNTDHYRYLYDRIDWNDSLIMVKGAQCVGHCFGNYLIQKDTCRI